MRSMLHLASPSSAVLVLLLAGCASNPLSNARYWTLDQCTSRPSDNIRFLNPDGSVLAVVPRKSCEALASAASKIQSQSNFTLYRIYIASIEQRNAFATRDKEGRSIAVVTLGMVKAVGQDEDAWAGLLGHEIAHHVKRHSEGRKEAQQNAKAAGQAAANVLGLLIPGVGGFVAGSVGGTATQMAMYGAYTRPQEAEADTVGLQWMTDAGYDPRGMSRLFSALAAGGTTPEALSFLSTHPANEERKRAVDAFIASHNSAPIIPKATAVAAAPVVPPAPIASPAPAVAAAPVLAKAAELAPPTAAAPECSDVTAAERVKTACVRAEGCEQRINLIKASCANASKTLCVGAHQQLTSFCVRDSKAYDEKRCDYAARSVADYCGGVGVAAAPLVAVNAVTAAPVTAAPPAVAKAPDIAPRPGTTNECSELTEAVRVKAACLRMEECHQHIVLIKERCAGATKTLCVAAHQQLSSSCVRASKAYNEKECDYAIRSVGNYCRD